MCRPASALIAVEPVEIPEAVEPVELEADADNEMLSSQQLIDRLNSQGIEPPSIRTLQLWAKDHQATKEGFSPSYIAKKIKGKLMWKVKH